MRNPVRDAASVFILLAFAGFGTMALVHEMLYQRSFWLLLGAALAAVPRAPAAR